MRSALFLAGLLAAGSLTWFGLQKSENVPAAAPEAIAAAPVRAVADEYAVWEALYRDATLEQVTQELALMRSELDAGTFDFYEREFARKAYVVEGRFERGEKFLLKKPGEDLCARRFLPTGEIGKVVLPREQFPEMYELRARVEWLAHRQDELSMWGK